MIRIRDLKVSFGGKPVLDGINLEVQRGELMVVLGKNGSGKSVLLKAAAGLITDYEGSIQINGIEARSLQYGSVSPLNGMERNSNLAYVFQKGGLFDSMNVFENVAFGLRRRKMEEASITSAVTEALGKVGLSGSEEKLPSELSGGMQKRVGLARAICLNPDIIMYDDPTAGLDPILSDSIADLILEITKSFHTTSLVVSHDLKVARKIANTVALLHGGRIVFSGAIDEFFKAENPYAGQFIQGEIEGPIDIY